ncbi:MAG: hypothetical protein ACJA01_002828 [Saprospiraceae bacterium]|jgi:hypothetical protein
MSQERVMISVSQIKIMTAKHVLKAAGIEAFDMDKRDSAHVGLFGDIQLYVLADEAVRARQILEQEEVI